MKTPFGNINWSDINWSKMSDNTAALVARNKSDLVGSKALSAFAKFIPELAGDIAAVASEVIFAPIPVVDIVGPLLVRAGVKSLVQKGLDKFSSSKNGAERPVGLIQNAQGSPSLKPV